MPNQQNPWSKHIPDGPFDAIVIGSGMGGMTSAAMLAKAGRKVLVLEQHYVPGGFTHAFRHKRWTWDVGVHAIGEVTEHAMPGRLLKFLTDDRLKWASLGPVYEEFHYPDNFVLEFPDNPTDFRKNLVEAFPDEEDAIDRYLALVRESSSIMRGYYLGRLAPAGVVATAAEYVFARKAMAMLQRRCLDVVRELTSDRRLQAVMVAQWGYYGAPPKDASFAVQALVSKHFLWGGYYPVGGSPRIAIEMLQTVADAGGWSVIRADVDEILVENGAAVGVRLKDGREARAKKVISAAGVSATVRRMLPKQYASESWAEEIKEVKAGPAHVCLYLGFEGDIREAGASGANKWFYEAFDPEGENSVWEMGPDGPIGPAPVLYTSFPSLKDPEYDPGPDKLHTAEVVTFVPWETFEKWKDERWAKRGPEYEALKESIATRMQDDLFRHMPKLAPMLRHAELSTPATTHHFVRPLHGSIYGLEPTPQRFATKGLRPRSPIKNLFFSGSEVTVGGVVGALMGGALAAVSAEPVAMAKQLRGVVARPG